MAAKSTKKRRTTKKSTKQAQENAALRDEIIILSVLAVCILLMISNFGLGGLVGDMVSSVLFGLFGWTAYAVPILLFAVIAFLVSNKGNAHAYIKAAAMVIFTILCATLLELIANPYDSGADLWSYYRQASLHHNAGGLLGGCLVHFLCPMIGVIGTYVVVIILGIICVILVTEKSLLKSLGRGGKNAYEGAKKHHETTSLKAAKRKEERQNMKALRAAENKENDKKEEKNQENTSKKKRKKQNQKVSGVSFDTTLVEKVPVGKSPDVRELVIDRAEPLADPAEDLKFSAGTDGAVKEATMSDVIPAESKKTQKRKRAEDTAETVLQTEAVAAEAAAQAEAVEKKEKEYKPPILSLLKRGKAGGGDSDEHLRQTAQKLEETLANFGVNVHVTNASCGPSVTRYELQPEQGVKVSKIVGLADDIKLNLAVPDLRIEAPIPGKAAVGIEVPNNENTAVMLRDLLESQEFKRSESKLTFAVGKDIAGKTVVADIAKMPHLLVAGATGSGKSVCINTIIMSILYKADPKDVKLILVDPKVVELNVYNGIPHLLIPVVTDPKKAAGALNWAVAEMMKRYQLFAEQNVRDLKGYNEKAEHMEPEEDGELPKKMPQIVIIVDELADLMMVAPKDVEGAICRLAQLARAAGIHLILATQRPSVNVITGLIKANMPSRIAFAVSSGVDSRTIIDMNGAEKLLGKGDMLFYPSGYPKPVRVQGSFVSDKEVQRVVEYLIEHNADASYNTDIEEHMNRDLESESVVSISGASTEPANERDAYFAEAGRLIIDKEKASIGMLQRMYKIGFNRAARIMDQLAEAGVVGPEEGTKPRKVLMTKEEFEQYLSDNT